MLPRNPAQLMLEGILCMDDHLSQPSHLGRVNRQ
jgi:hypothetical protein